MCVLLVDLDREQTAWAEESEASVATYLGGRGLGAQYLHHHLPAGADPLGPENILGLWASPLIGSGAPSLVKLCGVTKSPATGTILMSLMGGHFGPALRFASADAVILKGVAKRPLYLLIRDGEATLRPADHLWGMTTGETTQALQREAGSSRLQVAAIGPAGEKMAAFAAIVHGGHAMGRGGIGAVMGSKRLKAIAVSGRGRPPLEQAERFAAALERIRAAYRDSEPLKAFGVQGTTSHVDVLNVLGIYPTRNYQSGRFDAYEQVNSDRLYADHVNKRLACYGCPVRCRREAHVRYGPYAGMTTDGPEYETLWSFGGNCGNTSLDAVIAANELCNQYGLDTISTGMAISFAMECFEAGIISATDASGLELRFGNNAAITDLVQQISRREGLGDLLAQGTRRAAQAIGGGAERFAMQVKGLELAGYDPRGATGMGLGYATSPRGGCHERGLLTGEVFGAPVGIDRLAYEGRAQQVKAAQDAVAVKDALGFCVLASAAMSFADLAELFSAATGVERSAGDLLVAGERICNLERLFNLREGLTRADDTLPQRLLKEPIPDLDGEPRTVDLERLLRDYYAARGWDAEGRPSRETLQRLGLFPESSAPTMDAVGGAA